MLYLEYLFCIYVCGDLVMVLILVMWEIFGESHHEEP